MSPAPGAALELDPRVGALLGLAGAALLLDAARGVPAPNAAARVQGGRRRLRARTASLRGLLGRLDPTEAQLALAGEGKTPARFRRDRLLCALLVPAIALASLALLERQPPPLWLAPPLALAGLLVPDLALRRALARRRERILADLPDALAMIGLALAAGRSLPQALALAAHESGGPLGADLAAALAGARRDPSLDPRRALVERARASGEPTFTRFAELLALKESPYVEFLRIQAAQARGEQARRLDRAAERAYLAMHAPLAPLLTTLVLLVAYGFLHVLDQSI